MPRCEIRIRTWLVAATILLAAIFFVRGARSRNDQALLSDNSARVKYLASIGWEVEGAPVSEQLVRLPKEFPPVLEDYNRLQQQQGFDLKPHAGKEVSVYTYRVLNHESPEEVFCCLYLRKNRVIGGDVHSASVTGFMDGLLSIENG